MEESNGGMGMEEGRKIKDGGIWAEGWARE